MIELAQHIEVLLLENDCVIVPGLGGFVTNYVPATKVATENTFLPPVRVIGFNPRLKMNDGLLIQSYMTVYETNFSDALRRVEKEVREIKKVLHEDGKVELPNIGELHYSIHGVYDFLPYDNKITTPSNYGLDSFEMLQLSELMQRHSSLQPSAASVQSKEQKQRRRFVLNPSYLSNAAAVVAALLFFFFLSTPIENTEVVQGNYATLLPNELVERIESQSLALRPITVRTMEKRTDEQQKTAMTNASPAKSEKKFNGPTAVRKPLAPKEEKELKVKDSEVTKEDQTSEVKAKRYHIIIASVGTEKDAVRGANQLVEKGYADAKAIIGDGKMRVAIQSFETEAEAYRALNKIRQNETFQNAWVLKK